MSRIRLRTGPFALFGAVAAAALLALLPMRLALGWFATAVPGLAVRNVSGSIWAATLTDAQFAGIPLGDLDARVAPLPLLAGRLQVVLDGRAIGSPLHGAASVSRHGFGVEELRATLPTGTLFAPIPVGALDLDSLSVRFRDGQCLSAEGRVRATLVGGAGGIALPASVSGDARCDAGALLLPLASQAGTESIQLRITGAGTYRALLAMHAADPGAATHLAAAGFALEGGLYRLSIEGRF